MHLVHSVGDLLDVEVAREVGDILCRKPCHFISPSPEHDANLPPPGGRELEHGKYVVHVHLPFSVWGHFPSDKQTMLINI